MKHFYTAAITLFSTVFLTAQESKTIWQKDLKSSTQDFLTGITVTLDGQYLVSGSSIQLDKVSAGGIPENKGYDYRLLKLDQEGNKVWEKFISGNRHDYLSSSIATQEGGFLLAGTSYSTAGFDKIDKSMGGSDLWVIKVNENGDVVWQKTIGTRQNEEAKAVVESSDLGYFVAADAMNYQQGFGGKDGVVYRMDQLGNIKENILLGGKMNEEVERMIATKDGGVLIGIYSRSEGYQGSSETEVDKEINWMRIAKEDQNYGEGDYWVVKLNKEGQLQWQRSFGGEGDDRIKTLSLTENGFIIGGESQSTSSGNKQVAGQEGTDLWFVALDDKGEELWQKSYSFGSRDVLMSQNTIFDSSGIKSKGILVGGYTQAEGRIEQNDETFWMLYLDNNGDEVWRKYIEGQSKQKQERLVDAKLHGDGTYILAGVAAPELGKENWKILKLGDKLLEELIEKQDIRIYPNPVDDYCYVDIGFDVQGESGISLYDFSGKMIQKINTKNKVTKINTGGLVQGVYIISVKNQAKVVNTKILKK